MCPAPLGAVCTDDLSRSAQGPGLLSWAHTSFQSHPLSAPGPDSPSAPAAPSAGELGPAPEGQRPCGLSGVMPVAASGAGITYLEIRAPVGPPARSEHGRLGRKKPRTGWAALLSGFAIFHDVQPRRSPGCWGGRAEAAPLYRFGRTASPPRSRIICTQSEEKTHFCFAVYAPSSRNALEVILEAAAVGCFGDGAEEDMPHVYGF